MGKTAGFIAFLSGVSTLQFHIYAKLMDCHRRELSEDTLLLLLIDCLGLDLFVIVLTHLCITDIFTEATWLKH